jgi:type II secretory pathway component GspD/PulD (secretin)
LAQQAQKVGGRIIVCMIQIENADAEDLTAVLEPFLSPECRILPYRPTNTLIVRDQASVVDKLSIAIKRKHCNPIDDPSDIEPSDVKKESVL